MEILKFFKGSSNMNFELGSWSNRDKVNFLTNHASHIAVEC